MVLERLPDTGDVRSDELRRMRRSLAERPEDLALAIDLATRYIRLGRARSDPRYYGWAQSALANWWEEADPPVPVRVLRAVIRQYRHDFAGALEDLEEVNRRDPRNAQAWLSRSVIHHVLGEHALALQSCRPLSRLVSAPIAAACIAGAAAYAGEAGRSYELLRATLDASRDVASGDEAWALSVLAEIAVALGRDEDALEHVRRAQASGRRSATLLAIQADILLDQGRTEEVVDMLAGETGTDALLLRLAIAEKRAGSSEWEEHAQELEARMAATRARGDDPHYRSEARFQLELREDPARALARAAEGWHRQKEYEDARLLLEAALAAGQPDAAMPVVERLEADGTEHARLRPLVERVRAALQ